MAGSKADRAVRLKISRLRDQLGALFHGPFTCRTPWTPTPREQKYVQCVHVPVSDRFTQTGII